MIRVGITFTGSDIKDASLRLVTGDQADFYFGIIPEKINDSLGIRTGARSENYQVLGHVNLSKFNS
jgi:hypothetical protein